MNETLTREAVLTMREGFSHTPRALVVALCDAWLTAHDDERPAALVALLDAAIDRAVSRCDGAGFRAFMRDTLLRDFMELRKALGGEPIPAHARNSTPARGGGAASANSPVARRRDPWRCACGSTNIDDQGWCRKCERRIFPYSGPVEIGCGTFDGTFTITGASGLPDSAAAREAVSALVMHGMLDGEMYDLALAQVRAAMELA